MRNALWSGVAAAVLLLCSSSLFANLITFDLNFSGAAFGNGAHGSGFITFDDAILPATGAFENVTADTLGIKAFSITISGAASGNGTFGLADVSNWMWDVSTPLDFSHDLVGQTGFNDFNWCAFLFVDCTSPAPGGIRPFTIQTNAEMGDVLGLVSMRAVPEPNAFILLGAGLVAAAGISWKRKNRIAAHIESAS